MSPKTKSLVRASILDLQREDVVAVCQGADEHGECPKAHPGDVVPCAGHLMIAEADSVKWRLALEVGHFATSCPLRGFVDAADDLTE